MTSRARALLMAGLVTAAVYAALVAPGFAPVSYRYDTSRHGPHERRFLSGWRIEQHQRFRGNIVTRLSASRAVFEMPPIPTAYPLIMKMNIIPREACRFILAINDQPIGTITNTVLGRGEKHLLIIPPGLVHARMANRLTIVNCLKETSTEWENIQIRNYRGTVQAPHWYLLAGFGPRALWLQRLSPWHWFVPGLLGAALWFLTGSLRRSRLEWGVFWCSWGGLLGAIVVMAVLGVPLVASPFGLFVWWLLPSLVITGGRGFVRLFEAIRQILQQIRQEVRRQIRQQIRREIRQRMLQQTRQQILQQTRQQTPRSSALPRVTGTTLALPTIAWRRWWERRVQQWPARWAQPARYLVSGFRTRFVVLCIVTVAMLSVTIKLTGQWWRRTPLRDALYAFAGLLSTAAICRYLQWPAAAEWIGTIAFGALVLGVIAMLAAPAAAK